MNTSSTLDGLHALRLPGMARGLAEQREHPDYDALGFEERLAMLVDRELTERQNRRLERMLKAARLRIAASVEEIDFRRPAASSGPRCCPWPRRTGWTPITASSSWVPLASARPI